MVIPDWLNSILVALGLRKGEATAHDYRQEAMKLQAECRAMDKVIIELSEKCRMLNAVIADAKEDMKRGIARFVREEESELDYINDEVINLKRRAGVVQTRRKVLQGIEGMMNIIDASEPLLDNILELERVTLEARLSAKLVNENAQQALEKQSHVEINDTVHSSESIPSASTPATNNVEQSREQRKEAVL